MKITKRGSNRGITLIALVITIIVLLILAGVSIATLMGENGILTRAQTSRDNTEDATIKEKVKLAVQASYTEGKGIIKRDNLDSELKELFGTGKYELSTGEAPWTVKVEDYEATVNSTGKVSGEDKDKIVLDSTEETTPWLPAKATVTNNDLETGLTIRDSKGNEWVWIEVPKSITASATTDAEIETALKNYAATLVTNRGDYTDTWYDGCGLEESEYNTMKSTMLNSIKTNGGFYIGKYEVGYELKEGESVRYYEEEDKTEYPITQTPVIKENAYPYSFISVSQAQELSESLVTGGKTSSLMFGTQWDLVLKHLSIKENGKSAEELVPKSPWENQWGNCFMTTFDVTQGKYSEDYGATWKNVEGTYTKLMDSGVLLTTGATAINSSMNIYDLAGNVGEITLEKSSSDKYKGVIRGGYLVAYENSFGDLVYGGLGR